MKLATGLTIAGTVAIGIWLWALPEFPASVQSNATLAPIGSYIINNPKPINNIANGVVDTALLVIGILLLLFAAFAPAKILREAGAAVA